MMKEAPMRKWVLSCKSLHSKGGMILKRISDGKGRGKEGSTGTSQFFYAARIWWIELGRSRRRYGKSPIYSWEKMKKIMKSQFVPSSYHMRNCVVPSSYHNEFFGRFCKLQQGSQSVMEYHNEFLYLMDKANIKRCPEVLMD
ncbi:hypothetical protein Ahy_A01g002088 [Arachis hypogaea]|uniref:Retrotransposon gag domain-containing protein n=1 Tax=Arachis hypogaea TaxID=3818 RepID=A0A445EQ88_ARAHY|nr:hypothetical protein Ahy_A01g002088 [Arachis hypogaea]